MNPFWGPRINACIDWAKSIGIHRENFTPMQFYDAMCNATQVWPGSMQDPEFCAEMWLQEIGEIRKSA